MSSEKWMLWRFRLLLVLLMILGVGITYLGSSDLVHMLEPIGHALIISGLLGLTVDGYVKKHLLREASQDIAKYLTGKRVRTVNGE